MYHSPSNQLTLEDVSYSDIDGQEISALFYFNLDEKRYKSTLSSLYIGNFSIFHYLSLRNPMIFYVNKADSFESVANLVSKLAQLYVGYITFLYGYVVCRKVHDWNHLSGFVRPTTVSECLVT